MHKNRTGNGLRLEAKHQETYEKWWLGKRIKEGIITKVEYIGNAVYGFVELTLDNGNTKSVGTKSFRPRKKDLEILDASQNSA